MITDINTESANGVCNDGDFTTFENLVENNLGLVKSIARRFCGRGTDFDDLVQIGTIGLIKAAKAFDVSLSVKFSTYAFSMITGELRRYFRDDGLIKVSRSAKKNCAALLREKEIYELENGNEPTISYLAEKCGISVEEAVFCFGALSPVVSISESGEDELSIEEKTGEDNIDEYIEKLALKQALKALSPAEQRIIHMRYSLSMTQNDIAKCLCTSQAKISRAEKKILEKLRRFLA